MDVLGESNPHGRGRAIETYPDLLRVGQAYEAYVARQLQAHGFILEPYLTQDEQYRLGENRFGLEIKHDRRMATTKRVYIEVAERRDAARPMMTPSGIFRADACWLYGIGDQDRFYMFSRKRLQVIFWDGQDGTRSDVVCREIGTSRGFTIPVATAEAEADRIYGGAGQWQVCEPGIETRTAEDTK